MAHTCPKCGAKGYSPFVLAPEVKQGQAIGNCPRCGIVKHDKPSIFGKMGAD